MIGSVPTAPDPNTSAKVSRYKWELHRGTNWVVYTFCQEEGILLEKYRDTNESDTIQKYRGQGSI